MYTSETSVTTSAICVCFIIYLNPFVIYNQYLFMVSCSYFVANFLRRVEMFGFLFVMK